MRHQQHQQHQQHHENGEDRQGEGNGDFAIALPPFETMQQTLSQTKQKLSKTIQDLDIQQRLTESKLRLSQKVQKFDLDQKIVQSKETMRQMKLEERFKNAKKGIGGATSRIAETLSKINLARLIDKMEHDQEVADSLERRNRDLKEEQEAREMMRQAGAACTKAIETHLESFLESKPRSSYEEWISDLHPENFHEGKLLEGMDKELDHRFYVAESDHRLLWNKNLGGIRSHVFPRSQMGETLQSHQPPIDLLDQSTIFKSTDSVACISATIHENLGNIPVSIPSYETGNSNVPPSWEDMTNRSTMEDLTRNDMPMKVDEDCGENHDLILDFGNPTSEDLLFDPTGDREHFSTTDSSLKGQQDSRMWFEIP